MSDKGRFLVYCIEMYKRAKSANGRQVFELFERYGVIDYVMECYGALHTTGTQYIVDDIDRFLANQRRELA